MSAKLADGADGEHKRAFEGERGRRYGWGVAVRPILYLLTGLPCSGKTTNARELEATGVVRVSVDDMMIAVNGRLGVDYDHADHLGLVHGVVVEAGVRIRQLLATDHDTVLDHGLGRRSERDEFKRLAESCGASWELRCFDVDRAILRRRCRERWMQPDAVPISDEVLDDMAANWERPIGEGELVLGGDHQER